MKRRRRWGAVWAVALLGTVAVLLLSAAGSQRGGARGRDPRDSEWKDDWLRTWVAQQQQRQRVTRPAHLQPCPADAACAVPKHLPAAARGGPPQPQTVPRIIWQTWADNRWPPPNLPCP